VEKILKNKKIRTTPFRISVLNIFLNNSNAISIQQIEEELKDFDRITLYRTIKTFIEKGIVHEILMPGDVKKLALCKDKCSDEHHSHQHVHLKCNQCSDIFCVELDNFPHLHIQGYQIQEIEIQAKGVCKNCLV